ncbi:MAG: tetratricopeptide repeat protein [Helicobacteraceae bacterium]|jgi:Flp pilus assembly protein TadD|nr:tetratricopeptide repeat protein [Helicobacteraceae bacterium]
MKRLFNIRFGVVAKALIALCFTALLPLFAADKAAKEAFDRGLTATAQGNMQEAIKQFTQAIKIDPKYAKAYYNRGVVYEKIGDYKQAISDYNQAIKVDPNFAWAYNNRASAYISLNDYKNATKDARKACELGDCKALYYLAQNKLLRD